MLGLILVGGILTEEIKALFEERLGRYQAAIALEPTDRIPIGPGSNYFAEVFSGNNHQETLYDPEKWLEAEMAFIREFPETDVLRDNRLWAPSLDAVGLQTYRLPGRDLPPEGDWSPHWHHMLELPKGTIICDIDNQGSIFQAKRDIGHHQCLAGGIPDSQFILGTPEDVRKRVKELCDTLGPVSYTHLRAHETDSYLVCR